MRAQAQAVKAAHAQGHHDQVEIATAILAEAGEAVFTIGQLEACDGPAEIRIDLPAGWPA